MGSGPQKVPDEIYHRVYRLMKRDIDPRLIAAALVVPRRTIINVIAHLKRAVLAGGEAAPQSSVLRKAQGAAYLDVYFLEKARYAVVHPVGHLVKEKKEALAAELKKALSSLWKAVAIRLSDVVMLDETCARQLLDFSETIASKDRFAAILDPSASIEESITRFRIEETIPIFGTERAFEEKVFSLGRTSRRRVRGTDSSRRWPFSILKEPPAPAGGD